MMKILKITANILIIAWVLILVLTFWRSIWLIEGKELSSVFNKVIAYTEGDGIFLEKETRGELGGGISTEGGVKNGKTAETLRTPYVLGGLGIILVFGVFLLVKNKFTP